MKERANGVLFCDYNHATAVTVNIVSAQSEVEKAVPLYTEQSHIYSARILHYVGRESKCSNNINLANFMLLTWIGNVFS